MKNLITDWDLAYANSDHIPDGHSWPDAWSAPAASYRSQMLASDRAQLELSYGQGVRNRFDLFLPQHEPTGLVISIHGGYWLALDKDYWSHYAQGAIARGFAVAIPSYNLCPEVRIADIVREIGAAITVAANRISGPIAITGHSAGGHLAARMICSDTPLSQATLARVRRVVPISGLGDLRPLQRTSMNQILRIDDEEAMAQSPSLLQPVGQAELTCWVGGSERAEFLRQSALLANIWTGLGVATQCVIEPNRHHFNVTDGLAHADHPVMDALLAGL